jgi:hypothetical protein
VRPVTQLCDLQPDASASRDAALCCSQTLGRHVTHGPLRQVTHLRLSAGSVRACGEASAMRSYTVREAAEACGISYQAMRTRVDRGQLQVIKRDGTRRITESELEATGLLGVSSDPEVVRLRSENAQLRQELQSMRALPARIEVEREALERMEQAFHQARAERQVADQGAQAIRAQLEEIAAAGPIRALRLRRKLRAESAG